MRTRMCTRTRTRTRTRMRTRLRTRTRAPDYAAQPRLLAENATVLPSVPSIRPTVHYQFSKIDVNE